MKKVMLALALLSLVSTGSAHGQAGAIVLAGDVGTSGAQASEFSAPVPSCFTGTWLSDTVVFPVTIGNSQNGVSIGYGQCTPGPIHVLTINFFCQGTTSNCCYYRIKPHPDRETGTVGVVDCSDDLLTAKGGSGIVNPTDDCRCGELTRDSTWGKVKATFK
ncbi:MAG: hypothetical protein P8181_12520 [bacterium]